MFNKNLLLQHIINTTNHNKITNAGLNAPFSLNEQSVIPPTVDEGPGPSRTQRIKTGIQRGLQDLTTPEATHQGEPISRHISRTGDIAATIDEEPPTALRRASSRFFRTPLGKVISKVGKAVPAVGLAADAASIYTDVSNLGAGEVGDGSNFMQGIQSLDPTKPDSVASQIPTTPGRGTIEADRADYRRRVSDSQGEYARTPEGIAHRERVSRGTRWEGR